MEYQLQRLPKWAQQEINNLRSRLKHAENALAVMSNQTEFKGEVTFSSAIGISGCLPKRSQVTFKVGDGQIDLSVVDDELRVYSRGSLNIQPRAANSVYLKDF